MFVNCERIKNNFSPPSSIKPLWPDSITTLTLSPSDGPTLQLICMLIKSGRPSPSPGARQLARGWDWRGSARLGSIALARRVEILLESLCRPDVAVHPSLSPQSAARSSARISLHRIASLAFFAVHALTMQLDSCAASPLMPLISWSGRAISG